MPVNRKRKVSVSSKSKKKPVVEKENIQKVQMDKQDTFELPQIPQITNEWISATKTRNYVLDDPLIDWLNMWGEGKGFIPDKKYPDYDESLEISQFIIKQGVKFEAMIMEKLQAKFGSHLMTVTTADTLSRRMKTTLELMKAGIPIIGQGVIFDTVHKTYGIPDLMVRSDWLNQLTEQQVLHHVDMCCPLSKISKPQTNWHYRIIDIKFSTLNLRADATTLLNQGSQYAYKAQLFIYNHCLGFIQGYVPQRAYILGRGWKLTKGEDIVYSDNPFCKLGVIDYGKDGPDSDVCDSVNKALSWYYSLIMFGSNWTVYPPSREELYPNMCRSTGTGWDRAKKEIANKLHEITMLWQVGIKTRNIAHSKNIVGWMDPDCNARSLEITNPKWKIAVDRILQVNTTNNREIVPKTIKTSVYNWRQVSRYEFFIDFENVSSFFKLDDNCFNMIYLIGLGWMENEWKYESFLALSLDSSEEERILRKFLSFLQEKLFREYICPSCNRTYQFLQGNHGGCSCSWRFCPEYGWWDGLAQCPCFESEESSVKLWHYSKAEPNMLDRAIQQIEFSENVQDEELLAVKNSLELCDLYTLLTEEPIAVRGAFDYGLKSVASALEDLKKIPKNVIKGSQCQPCDGLQSMIAAVNCYTTGKFLSPLMKAVVDYNESDVKSMYDILNYLRKEH